MSSSNGEKSQSPKEGKPNSSPPLKKPRTPPSDKKSSPNEKPLLLEGDKAKASSSASDMKSPPNGEKPRLPKKGEPNPSPSSDRKSSENGEKPQLPKEDIPSASPSKKVGTPPSDKSSPADKDNPAENTRAKKRTTQTPSSKIFLKESAPVKTTLKETNGCDEKAKSKKKYSEVESPERADIPTVPVTTCSGDADGSNLPRPLVPKPPQPEDPLAIEGEGAPLETTENINTTSKDEQEAIPKSPKLDIADEAHRETARKIKKSKVLEKKAETIRKVEPEKIPKVKTHMADSQTVPQVKTSVASPKVGPKTSSHRAKKFPGINPDIRSKTNSSEDLCKLEKDDSDPGSFSPEGVLEENVETTPQRSSIKFPFSSDPFSPDTWTTEKPQSLSKTTQPLSPISWSSAPPVSPPRDSTGPLSPTVWKSDSPTIKQESAAALIFSPLQWQSKGPKPSPKCNGKAVKRIPEKEDEK